jgi:hypothetical protein
LNPSLKAIQSLNFELWSLLFESIAESDTISEL